MFQYRQVLLRMRQGDSDRDIARSRLMGRPKVAAFRLLAAVQGWLSPEAPLPDDAAIAAVLSAPRRASSTISSVEPYRAQVERWAVTCRAIFGPVETCEDGPSERPFVMVTAR